MFFLNERTKLLTTKTANVKNVGKIDAVVISVVFRKHGDQSFFQS